MKLHSSHIFFTAISILAIISCGKDYSAEIENLKAEIEKQQKEVTDTLKAKGCLVSFGFRSIDNAQALIHDTQAEILESGAVQCRIPHIIESKKLVPTFTYVGTGILFDGKPAVSGKDTVDFTSPVSVTIKGEDGDDVQYTVSVIGFTGLPIVYIETEGRAAVVSKEEKVNCTVRIVEDIRTKAAGDVLEATATIKGRGNSTWPKPKKPYKIKFDKKQSVLGMPADKEWVLLANYMDKTQIRNHIAFYMGRNFSNLDYTCRTHFAELVLNGEFMGTYLVGEHQKIATDRVNVTDKGYLMEIDKRAESEDDARIFYTKHLDHSVNIKDPEIEYNTPEFEYIKNFVSEVDSIIFSTHFANPSRGYAKYIDVDSFVDWYLLNELAKNNDAAFWSSCYMHHQPGGKLIMGPIWDFDLGWGGANINSSYKTEGLWVGKYAEWYKRLLEDPSFVDKVRERLHWFESKLPEIYMEINDAADYLKYSEIENDAKWHILYTNTGSNYNILGCYDNEIQDLKKWISERFKWMVSYFDSYRPAAPEEKEDSTGNTENWNEENHDPSAFGND